MDTKKNFYLGRIFDPKTNKTTPDPLLYEPDDLTTHAVVVGMTGSGKTGLCIGLLEEAALNKIPALMIDPKGDITNTLLHFPNLLPKDFLPWINPDEARRSGVTLEQAAKDTASRWSKGLQEWGIGPDRLQTLKEAAHFAIYTPGSDAGIPISILASLNAPEIPWENNRELLREKISGTVTAILGLVGFDDVDPVQSREHILLANIFEQAWSKGKNLELGELILQTQNPPFPKLGVFEVNTFFPEKDRFELAMRLNNILASPSFQSWIEGEPLTIPNLLYGPDSRPRHSVFYIAHLSDTERMFFVTLLFSAVESWMRTQSGTTSLRTILYFDEIFGYLPPIKNPPSKLPMLRMLKQARAFGLGLVLVTQNPVDVDYKGLSNAGTWLIGKLQTDQDKQRLLDGLQSAMSGNIDRNTYDRLISGLNKRVFLLHNVHHPPAPGRQLFQTRWAMNYLAGPLTRSQIPALNQLAGAVRRTTSEMDQAQPTSPPYQAAPSPKQAGQRQAPPSGVKVPTTFSTRPATPAGIAEYFLPNNLTLNQAFKSAGREIPGVAVNQGLFFKPTILAQALIRFLDRKYSLDHQMVRTVLVAEPERRGAIHWENFETNPVEAKILDNQPELNARFTTLEAPFTEAKTLVAMQKDFLDWVFHSTKIEIRANETLQIFAGPEVSQASFRQMCTDAARKSRDAEIKRVNDTYNRKLATWKEKLAREERELSADQSELSQRKMEELGTHAENVLGLFGGRKSSRRLSSSLTKRRLTQQAKADVEESLKAIEELRNQINALESEKNQALEEINQRWGEVANQINEISLTPLKKDIILDLFGIAWFPYYSVQIGQEIIELPAYGSL